MIGVMRRHSGTMEVTISVWNSLLLLELSEVGMDCLHVVRSIEISYYWHCAAIDCEAAMR